MNLRFGGQARGSRRVRRFLFAALMTVGAISGIDPARSASAAVPPVTNQRNFALGATATQSSSAYGAGPSLATDGVTIGWFDSGSVTHTTMEAHPWWQVDLGATHDVDLVRVWNRWDCCPERLNDFWVFLSAVPFTSNDPAAIAADKGVTAVHVTTTPSPWREIPVTTLTRYVRVQLSGTNSLSLAEVEVIGQPFRSNYATDAVASQSSTRYGGSAAQAIDANTDGDFGHKSVSHTKRELKPWWQADLGHSRYVAEVRVWNRTDCCADRLSDFWVYVSDKPFTSNDPAVLATRADVKSVHITSPPSPMALVPIGVSGRYVRVQLSGTESLNLAEVEINGPQLRNYVPGGRAKQSTTDFGAIAENAQDGNTDGNFYSESLTHTAPQNNPWWQVDLGAIQNLNRLKIWNRTDCCTDRLRDFWVFMSASPFISEDPQVTAWQPGVVAQHFTNVATTAASPATVLNVPDVPARYIRVQIPGGGVLSLAEVEAFGTETLAPIDALGWNARHPFGMFLHYGMATATDEQWATPGTPPSRFNPPSTVDPTVWASAIKSAGMTWGALTVKHHDGFALWPTAYSSYSIASSPYQQGKGDIMRDYANAMHAQHLDVGIYFSIWDRTNRETPALVKNQLRELLTNYGPISYIFFDGWGWDFLGPNRIKYNEIREFVRQISPETVVANNDHRLTFTSSDFLVTEYYGGAVPGASAEPKELATTLDRHHTWFWTTGVADPQPTDWVITMRDRVIAANGHFLLNVGPRLDGTIDPRYLTTLQQVGQKK